MSVENYIYRRFENTSEYKIELIDFFKHSCNAEVGGNKIFDGSRSHATQSPYEMADLIFALKEYEIKKKISFKSFLEIGFSAGITNTTINKFFNFDNIVGIDLFKYIINSNVMNANIVNKNLTLLCANTTSPETIKKAEMLGPYDLIFIDADHSYDGVKKDFNNYKSFLNNNGVIAFHDVANPDWPGVKKLFDEIIKSNKYEYKLFISKGFPIQYGIGMIYLK